MLVERSVLVEFSAARMRELEIKPEPGSASPLPESLRGLVIQNQGPIRAAMVNGNIRVETARVTARSTDLNLAGTVNLNSQSPLNLLLETQYRGSVGYQEWSHDSRRPRSGLMRNYL